MAKTPRILLTRLVGHSDSLAENRRIGQGIKEHGWRPLVDRSSALLDHDTGFDGIVFKNPGGALLDEPMQLTQWTQAREAGLDWLFRDFDEVMTELATSMRARDYELMFYLGGYQEDRNVLAGRFDAEMWKESIGTFVRLGASIGIDAMHNVKSFGASLSKGAVQNALRIAALMQYCNADARCYVETYPHKSDDYLNGRSFGAIFTNVSSAGADFDSAWATWMKQDFRGNPADVIVFIERPPAGANADNQAEWMAGECRKFMDRGWSVAYNPAQPGMLPHELGLK